MITTIIAYAFVIYWLVSFVRALPKIEGRFLLGYKPWGCDLCMTSWAGLALGLLVSLWDIAPAWWWYSGGGWQAIVDPVRRAAEAHALPVFAATGLALAMARWKSGAPEPGAAMLEQFLTRR